MASGRNGTTGWREVYRGRLQAWKVRYIWTENKHYHRDSKKNGAGTVTFVSGWMVEAGGKLKLNTPYGGK